MPTNNVQVVLIIVYICIFNSHNETSKTGILKIWSGYTFGKPGLEVIKLEFILKLKIKRNDWLLEDT